MARSRIALLAAVAGTSLLLYLVPQSELDVRSSRSREPREALAPPGVGLPRHAGSSPQLLFRGRPVSFWREKVKRDQFAFGGWVGTLVITNDPPVWVPGPTWGQILVDLSAIRLAWEHVTIVSWEDPQAQDLVPLLLEFLEDDDPLIRKVAAHGLGPYGSGRWQPVVVPALARALHDRYGDVRWWAARSVLMLGPRLDPDVQRAAEEIRESRHVPQVFSIRIPLTDQSLEKLDQLGPLPESLEHVVSLTAAGTAVSDAGLPSLARLPRLERLDLSGTRVTDTGLAALKGFPRLQKLELAGTAVSEAGIQELRRSRPGLVVVR